MEPASTGEVQIPELVSNGLRRLIKLEDAAMLSAGQQTAEERLGYRNDCRPHLLTTQAGDIDLQDHYPKGFSLRVAAIGQLPALIFEPSRRLDKALYAVVIKAYVTGA